MTRWTGLFARDVRRSLRSGGGVLGPAIFLVALALLFAFASDNDAERLRALGIPALVLSVALVGLLGLERLFGEAVQAGRIEQDLLLGFELVVLTISRLLAHTVAAALPAILLAPLIALLFGLQMSAVIGAAGIVALLVIAVTCAGAAPAALAAERPRAALLIALMVPPFLAPSVIFASAWLRALDGGTATLPPALLLVASVLVAMVVGIAGATAALRMHLD